MKPLKAVKEEVNQLINQWTIVFVCYYLSIIIFFTFRKTYNPEMLEIFKLFFIKVNISFFGMHIKKNQKDNVLNQIYRYML